MRQDLDWQSPDFARAFDNFDRPDFAHEFLRRNQAYRDDYAEAVKPASPGNDQRLAIVADHWGLVFRGGP